MSPSFYFKISNRFESKRKVLFLTVAISVFLAFLSIFISIPIGKNIFTPLLFTLSAAVIHLSWWLLLTLNLFQSDNSSNNFSSFVFWLKAIVLNLWLLFGIIFIGFLIRIAGNQINNV